MDFMIIKNKRKIFLDLDRLLKILNRDPSDAVSESPKLRRLSIITCLFSDSQRQRRYPVEALNESDGGKPFQDRPAVFNISHNEAPPCQGLRD